MNWDDLRFVASVAREGSLLKAARRLGVEHTTVGRRLDAAERALHTRLFVRTQTGLVLTNDGQRLLQPLQNVEQAVDALERQAGAEQTLTGTVRVTAPETFGVAWLGPRLALFAREHRGLTIDLNPGGEVLDLGRRQAEVAVRFFRSKQKDLIIKRAGEVAHGLYASRSYLLRHPLRSPKALSEHALLTVPRGSVEADWFAKLSGEARPAMVCTLTLALLHAAKAGAGIAVLPRYLGDAEPELTHLPMNDEPRETLWLTLHKDLQKTPRVRALLDHLIARFTAEADALRGRARD